MPQLMLGQQVFISPQNTRTTSRDHCQVADDEGTDANLFASCQHAAYDLAPYSSTPIPLINRMHPSNCVQDLSAMDDLIDCAGDLGLPMLVHLCHWLRWYTVRHVWARVGAGVGVPAGSRWAGHRLFIDYLFDPLFHLFI